MEARPIPPVTRAADGSFGTAVEDTELLVHGAGANTAGVLGTPGSVVYTNLPRPGENIFWRPGGNQRLADDMVLHVDGCSVSSYSIVVVGNGTSGLPFNVTTALWDGEPCAPGSGIIEGTQFTHTGVPNNGSLVRLDTILDSSVSVPRRVWLSVTFSSDDGGWLITEDAEVGFTEDVFSQQDEANDCLLGFLKLYSGFAAQVRCDDFGPEPTGACCRGNVCSVQSEAECQQIDGVWHGPGKGCDPDPCAKRFDTYRNDKPIDLIVPVPNDSLLADDMTTADGTGPCDLAFFRVNVFGFPESGSYDVTVDLRTVDPLTLMPGDVIPGTSFTFSNLPEEQILTLQSDVLSGVTLPETVWMVMSTSTDDSGWVVAERAEIGRTADAIAVFDHPDFEPAGEWIPVSFREAPEFPAVWSGLQAQLVCTGRPPTGACCSDAAGTCVDGVRIDLCDGRWVRGAACNADPFDPSCGTAACCQNGSCTDETPEDCVSSLSGIPVPGSFCADALCPREECLSATGDCFTTIADPTRGCGDPSCCEIVCTEDPFCCETEWDDICVEGARDLCSPANDHCANAREISGAGVFPFVNAGASTDGAPHGRCAFLGNDEQVVKDVWYRWTSKCTGPVVVQTCGLSAVDTKIAVYDGTGPCPPGDAHLRDCDDDRCSASFRQSMAVFDAVAGSQYLIRVGLFPGNSTLDGTAGGSGDIQISCGLPSQSACGAGTNDCCAASPSATGACTDTSCCELVCACDPFCCEVEWDEFCAGFGFSRTGCGAALLCRQECNCPDTCGDINGDGVVDFLDVAAFFNCMGRTLDPADECRCADLNLDGQVDGTDFNLLFDLLGRSSASVPPHCF